MKRLRNWYSKYKNDLRTIAEVSVYLIAIFAYSASFKSNLLWQILAGIYIILALYSKYQKRKKLTNELKEKGLTPADVTNIDFVKNWDTTRKTGIKRFCLLEGGLMTGIMLFIPLSFILFLVLGLTEVLSSFSHLIIAALISLATSYLIGVIIYVVRWKANERRFIRLTDPFKSLA